MTTASAVYSQAPFPASAAPAPIAARGPFIVSPGFDAVFFFASTASVLLAWAASSLFHVNGFYVLAAVAVISNGPHLVATWTRVYFDKREWRKRPWKIFLMPVLITAAIVAVLQLLGFKGSRVLNTALLYWAVWHFVQQNWGLLRLYQKRSGEPDTSLALRLERPMLYVFVAWCFLHRLQTGPRRLFGTELFYVPIPLWAVNLLLVVAALMAVAWIGLRLREGTVGWTKSALIRGGFLGCAALGFFVPFLLITTDDTSGFAAAACWHGLQYIGIVHFYHRNAWKKGVHPDARLVSWLTQPGWLRLFGFAVLLWALAGSGYVVIYAGSLLTQGTTWTVYTWGSVVWLSLTFSHYYLDGVIWKLSKDPKVAERLAVGS